jgi:hypothetical protein
VAGSLLSAPAGQSPIDPGGSSLGSGGLLGSGPVTGPSGDSSSSGTSPTGTPSEAPSYGGGQPAGGQAGNVEDQLARTWAEYRKAWYDWAWGVADTAMPGGEYKDAAEAAVDVAKGGIKLKAQRDLEKSQAAEAGGIGGAPDNVTDRQWKNYQDVTGKKSLEQNRVDVERPAGPTVLK